MSSVIPQICPRESELIGVLREARTLADCAASWWEDLWEKRGLRAFIDSDDIEVFWETGRLTASVLFGHAVSARADFFHQPRWAMDIGCSLGRVERWLVKPAGPFEGVEALEVSRSIIEKARGLKEGVGYDLEDRVCFKWFDGCTIPPGPTVDMIFSWNVVEYLPSVEILKEWLRSSVCRLSSSGLMLHSYYTPEAPVGRWDGVTEQPLRLWPGDWKEMSAAVGLRVVWDSSIARSRQQREVVLGRVYQGDE